MNYKLPVIERKLKKGDASGITLDTVEAGDYGLPLITESCIINLEGNRPVLYLNLDDPIYDLLLPHLKELKFNKSNRKATGKNNFSILAGGIPAATNHFGFCNVGSLLRKDSDLHYLLIQELSYDLRCVFEYFLPQWYKVSQHFYEKAAINQDYQMPETPWTSAILNHNSPHIYHTDTQNVKNIFSAMLTLKNNVSGGYLVLRDYGVALQTRNRSITIFYGRNIVHGVSPISYHGDDAYRYTLVFFAMELMNKCESIDKEFNKA